MTAGRSSWGKPGPSSADVAGAVAAVLQRSRGASDCGILEDFFTNPASTKTYAARASTLLGQAAVDIASIVAACVRRSCNCVPPTFADVSDTCAAVLAGVSKLNMCAVPFSRAPSADDLSILARSSVTSSSRRNADLQLAPTCKH
jgi:hypothetical protein